MKKAILLASAVVATAVAGAVVLGGSAANALLEIQEPISKLRGRWLEYKKSNGEMVSVMASFHPAYLLRNAGQKAKAWSDLLRLSKKIM